MGYIIFSYDEKLLFYDEKAGFQNQHDIPTPEGG